MNPKVTELINGYLIEWADPVNLKAKVSRIRMPSDGQVKGELEIRYSMNGKSDVYLLVPTQFNFSSEPTRARLAKQLAEKLEQDIEWKEILDYLSQKIQELARAGEAYVEIFPVENAPAPEQLLEGIIYKGVQNIIYGEKGVLKSTVAYLLAMCVTLPWHDNPLDLKVYPETMRTLVLDWETDDSIFRYYVSRLQRGMSIPPCTLFYRRCSLPLADDVEAIQNHIEKIGAKLLIIDSLGAAAGGERGELKGSESALIFNTALRKLNITSLIIGQSPRSEEGKRSNIYGTVFFTYYARNILELCRGQEEYEDSSHLALFHRDCNLGRKMRPIGLRIDFNDTTGAINVVREPVSISEFTERISTSMKILEILKGGAIAQKDLKEITGASYSNISASLRRLLRQGKVIKMEDKWGLQTLV